MKDDFTFLLDKSGNDTFVPDEGQITPAPQCTPSMEVPQSSRLCRTSIINAQLVQRPNP